MNKYLSISNQKQSKFSLLHLSILSDVLQILRILISAMAVRLKALALRV